MSALDKLQWGCPDCGRTTTRRPYNVDGHAFHSWKCKREMVQIKVQVIS